jgi:hypothetical protein
VVCLGNPRTALADYHGIQRMVKDAASAASRE